MVFFRVKKIKGKEYAYLVENEWISGKARQKVKGYLGRAFHADLKNDADFLEFAGAKYDEYLKKKTIDIMHDLIEWEASRHGVRSQFSLELEPASLTKDGREVVLMMNDGFMCRLTLRNLIDFKPINHEQDTFLLARAFVEAGIKVPPEIFIGLCEKMFKFEE